MRIIIHDLDKRDSGIIPESGTEETVCISDNGKIKPCICCYGCWLKTPGQCVIHDGYENMGALFSKCGELIIISRCIYGGFSPFVKNVLDRSACPSLLPYFRTRRGETHHPRRYNNKIDCSAFFYGDIPEAEKETARKLVSANKTNLYRKSSAAFYQSFEEIKGALN